MSGICGGFGLSDVLFESETRRFNFMVYNKRFDVIYLGYYVWKRTLSLVTVWEYIGRFYIVANVKNNGKQLNIILVILRYHIQCVQKVI